MASGSAKTAGEALAKTGDATKAGAKKASDALSEWSKAWQIALTYVANMSKIQEEQVTKTMSAMAESIKSVSGELVAFAPLIHDLIRGNVSFTAGPWERRIADTFDQQRDLVYSQIQLNESNIRILAQRERLLAAGAAPFLIKLSVEGTNAAFAAMVREVINQIVVKATAEGGSLCCA